MHKQAPEQLQSITVEEDGDGDYYVHHRVICEDFAADYVINETPYSESHAITEAMMYEYQVMVLRDAEDADFPGEPV